jgi:hypothetical protein
MMELKDIPQKCTMSIEEHRQLHGINKFEHVEEIQLSPCQICGKRRIKHIWKGDGWRCHVNRWIGGVGRLCSEPDCEENHGEGKCKKGE